MENKKKFWKGALCGALIMFIICVVFGVMLASGVFGFRVGNIVSSDTNQKLQMIRALMAREYLYYEDISDEALQDALVKGYVEGLDEPYTVYYDAAETKALFENTKGEFGGIGIGISQDVNTNIATFVTIYEDTPGEEAGFQVGDIVYKVDGEDVSGLDLDTIVSKIRGEVGTTVEITVLRGENMQEYTSTVTRALIENDTVNYEMKDGKLGYIQVTGFEDVTYKQFAKALDELKKQKMKGLVIDLRSNPGGNLSTVCDMLDLILPEGTIVSIKDRDGKGETYTSDAKHQLEVPLVVLINGYSASASEIFAGAVKDHGIGTLVGTTTYGKGVVQEIYGLPGGTAFKITSSEYFTPSGKNIHGVGVEPDVEIEYAYDKEHPEKDNQLEKALEILK